MEVIKKFKPNPEYRLMDQVRINGSSLRLSTGHVYG